MNYVTFLSEDEMKKNIYIIVTDVNICSVKDLKKLESSGFATITDMDNGCGSYETFNATTNQACEVIDIITTCQEALIVNGLLYDDEEE